MDAFDSECELLTVTEHVEGNAVRLVFGDGRREIHSRTVGLDELRRQGLAAAMGGSPRQLAERFGGAEGARSGEDLCAWLFGDNAEQSRLVRRLLGERAGGLQPNVRALRLRLELSFAHEELLEQPWHLLAWMGQRLVTAGWVIYLAPKEHELVSGRFAWPPRMLLIAPEYDAEVRVREHVDALEQIFVDADVPANSVVRASSREALEQACRGECFDIVYFYGHGDLADDCPRIILEVDDFGDRCADPFELSELDRILPRSSRPSGPLLVYLNTCKAGGGGFQGAGNLLSGKGRVVLSHLCAVEASSARARAERFFEQLLVHHRSPVSAFMPETGRLSRDPLAWMAGAVHGSIREWKAPRESAAPTRHDPRWVERLDRDVQRSRVTDVIRTSLTPSRSLARAVAFLGVGQEGNLIRGHGEQLFNFVTEDLNLGRPCFRIEVEVPRNKTATQGEWSECLLAALGARGDNLSTAVRAYLKSKHIVDANALLWIDFGGWPRRGHRDKPGIMDWVDACRHWVQTIDAGPRLRLGLFLGVEGSADYCQAVRRKLDSSYLLRVNRGHFELQVLDELRPVGVLELARLLRQYQSCALSCDEQVMVAEAIQRACADDSSDEPLARYERSLDFLKRGRDIGWPALLRELPPDPTRGADEERI